MRDDEDFITCLCAHVRDREGGRREGEREREGGRGRGERDQAESDFTICPCTHVSRLGPRWIAAIRPLHTFDP
jgi:hypothetical protein